MGATDEASCCSSSVAQQDNRIFRGIAQLVEQRSPKPRAVGSNPTAPANKKVSFVYQTEETFLMMRSLRNVMRAAYVMRLRL